MVYTVDQGFTGEEEEEELVEDPGLKWEPPVRTAQVVEGLCGAEL